tara:strand:+ start:469 stop:729 length:261 start_codon:yes stop_codon:yes gene_type:complete
MEEVAQQTVTFTVDDKTYDVNKFTNEAKVAVVRISRLNAEINALTEQAEDKKAASVTYKSVIDGQLSDEMLIEEEEESIKSDSHEI